MTATVYSAPNYPLRRAVAGVLALIVLVLAASAALSLVEAVTDLGGRPAAASEITTDGTVGTVVRVHVAEAGDTLWSIADVHRGAVDRGRYVDALIDLNGGTQIQIGQAVRLP